MFLEYWLWGFYSHSTHKCTVFKTALHNQHFQDIKDDFKQSSFIFPCAQRGYHDQSNFFLAVFLVIGKAIQECSKPRLEKLAFQSLNKLQSIQDTHDRYFWNLNEVLKFICQFIANEISEVPVEISLVYWRYKARNFSLHYSILKYFKNNNYLLTYPLWAHVDS